MRADNSHHLTAAAQQRSQDARRRAELVLQELQHRPAPVTIAGFVRSAGVSRSWLYTQQDLLDALRSSRRQGVHPASPHSSAASEQSLLRRLELAHQRVQELGNQNKQLREQLALAYGRQRLSRAEGTHGGDRP